MMNINCSWLPNEIEVDLNLLPKFVDKAYDIFINDFVKSHPLLNGFPVYVRRYPEDEQKNRYFSFNHITTKDYSHINNKNSNNYEERDPDIRRIERIAWIKQIIEHPTCIPKQNCNCSGVMLWYEAYKKTYRVNIMLYDENFMVVLEKVSKNKEFYLLITAFYFNDNYEREKRYKKYRTSTYTPSKL